MKFFQRFLVCLFLFCFLACPVFAQLSGELLEIQPIFFLASDIKISEDQIQKKRVLIEEVMLKCQKFYADEMERHGYGHKTFSFNKNVQTIQGKKKLNQYESLLPLWAEVPERKTLPNSTGEIYVVFLAGAKSFRGVAGVEQSECYPFSTGTVCNNLAVIAMDFEEGIYIEKVTAHEIGHAFGLPHVYGKELYIMHGSNDLPSGVRLELGEFKFHEESAAKLNNHLGISKINIDTTHFTSGDVNNDGYVDLYDVIIVRSAMTIANKYDTDVNNDGITDESDLAIVKLKAMEAIVAAAPRKRKVKITTWGALKRKKKAWPLKGLRL